MKYSITLPLLAAVRKFTEGMNAEVTAMPRSSGCSHFCIDFLPPLRVGLGEDREGLLLVDYGFYLRLAEDPIYETN